jgi:hypothetical protein
VIAHFALMGDLYQYEHYNTEASLWNSYPWQIGAENHLNVECSMPEFGMGKTIWCVDENDSSMVISSVAISSFSMYSSLITIDNYGNIGGDVGNHPNPIPPMPIGILGGSITQVTTKALATDIEVDSYSEHPDEPVPNIGILNGSVTSTTSRLTIISIDSNSERLDEPVPSIGILNGSITAVSSELGN